MDIYKQLIKEIHESMDRFGKVLFGDEETYIGRKLNHQFNRQPEPDTKFEKKVLNHLISHFRGMTMGGEKGDTFKILKQYQNQFPEELTPSTNDLYRIEFIDDNFLKAYPKSKEGI
jgi:hypothetical protein